MERARIRRFIFGLAAACALSAACGAQTPVNADTADLKWKAVPASTIVAPFPLDAHPARGTATIAFLPESRMAPADRDLLARAMPSIEKNAAFAGIQFDGSGWRSQQLVCPAFPNHILVRFTRRSGSDDASMFSAAIPRGGNGAVHVVPIQRRGYSLFSPASVNPLTISSFNRIRSEEPSSSDADWLATGLCYAALAGAQPALPPRSGQAAGEQPPQAMPLRMLEVEPQGGAIVHFAAATATHRTMEWSLTFDQRGKLVKVALSPVPRLTEEPVP